MTELVIHGPPESSYVRTARMIAVEKGLAYRLAPLDFKGPAHLAMHPWGRVPILTHGETELIETSAIARYLDAIGAGAPLVPREPVRLAETEKWISIINCYAYGDLVTGYLFHYIFPKTDDKQPDRAAIAAAAPAVERDLRLFERGFRGDWLTGSTLSLADLFLAPILAYVAPLPEAKAVLESCPNLRRFGLAMAARASFTQTVPPRG